MPSTRTLQELIIAVHFEAPLALSVLDLASWVERFSGQFPIVQQLPTLPAANLAVSGQMQFQMVSAPELPRMLIRGTDGRYSLQLQNDRFALGWHRTEPIGEPSEYPGFEAIQELWEATLEDFGQWVHTRFHQPVIVGIVELSYNNAARLEKNGARKKLSEIFTFVQPSPRPVHAFGVNWVESVYPDDPLKARVAVQVALGVAPPAYHVLAFMFSGLGKVVQGQESKHMLSDIHGKIREIYESSIVTDAD